MQHIQYAQMGAGGLTWLIFLAGLLWCNFAWWRANRCKRALISLACAIVSVLGIITMIGLIAAALTGLISSSLLSGEVLEAASLACLIMMAICWALSSIVFLLASIKNKQTTVTQPRG